MSSETQASNTPSSPPEKQSSARPDAPAASGKNDASVRTAMVAGWFGIAGTLLTCLVTWALNRVDKSPESPVPTSITAPAPQKLPSPAAAVSVVAAENLQPATPKLPRHEELLRQSPISFADWQALVRDRLSVEQRRILFGSEVGKRVTWQGVFDQYNLITLAPITRDDAYLLVLYEKEADRHATPLRPAPALCHFPALAKRQLAELRPGQRIVISGTLSNPDFAGQLLGTELQMCELVAVLDK